MLYRIWTLPQTKIMMKKMDVVEMRTLRREMGLKKKDKVRNGMVWSKSGVKEVSITVRESGLRWKRRVERYLGRRNRDSRQREEWVDQPRGGWKTPKRI